MKSKAVIMILSAALFGCGYDSFPGADAYDIRSTDLSPNTDIGFLRESYLGHPITIVENVIIRGYVTANDRSGNYYKSFVIQDGTGAVKINAGVADLHNAYRVGRQIVVKARGMALGSYNDVIQLGRKVNPYSDYRVEDFGTRAILEQYVFTGIEIGRVRPLELRLDELDRSHCGKLVRLGKLLVAPTAEDDRASGPVETWQTQENADEIWQLKEGIMDETSRPEERADQTLWPQDDAKKTPRLQESYDKTQQMQKDSGATWAFPGGGGKSPATGYRQFHDRAGNSITVVTSGYANFASRPIPADSVTLTGILIYGKLGGSREGFGLKLRDEGDID